VIQSVLHLHVCAKPTATGADYAADSATEPLHSVADSAAAGVAPTETS
jgi:hypothetical protein